MPRLSEDCGLPDDLLNSMTSTPPLLRYLKVISPTGECTYGRVIHSFLSVCRLRRPWKRVTSRVAPSGPPSYPSHSLKTCHAHLCRKRNMASGFFRGTTADQDARFGNAEKRLMKKMKFASVSTRVMTKTIESVGMCVTMDRSKG